MKGRAGLPKGVTLIELLVVIAVLMLLMAFLAPAVFSARAAARKMFCANNLKQLAAATHLYHEAHGMLPLVASVAAEANRNSLLSIQAQLLPYLEQAELYDRLNLKIPQPIEYGNSGYLSVNVTAARSTVSVLLCPENGGALRPGNSYRGNWGVGIAWINTPERPDSANGIFAANYYLPLRRFRDCSDGLSKTALFAERSLGGRIVPINGFPNGVFDADRAAAICNAADKVTPAGGAYDQAGREWLYSGLHHTLYNHGLPPNSVIPDCLCFSYIPPNGLVAARSYHPSGVNVVRADGSGQFWSDGGDYKIWRALGTINGGETVADF